MRPMLFILSLLAVAPITTSAADLSIWTTLQAKKTFFNKLSLSTSAGLHTRSKFSGVQVLSVGETAYYRISRNFGASASYYFITYNADRIKDSDGVLIEPFWSPRHSFSVAGIGILPISNVDCSLRVTYNMIYRPEHTIFQHDEYKVIDEKINEKLRLRFRATWNIPQSRWKPYLNIERFVRLSGEKKPKLEKTRYAVGTDFTINSSMAIQGFFLYQDHADDIELCGSVVGATYKISF